MIRTRSVESLVRVMRAEEPLSAGERSIVLSANVFEEFGLLCDTIDVGRGPMWVIIFLQAVIHTKLIMLCQLTGYAAAAAC